MTPELIDDRYRVKSAIGRGGMGTVWLCTDEVLGRHVAVKQVGLLPGESVTDSARALREARSSAALNHRNVVSVFDVTEVDGALWIVMEYVPSRTLSQLVRDEGPLPPARVAAIGAQVADGLAAAHAAGTIHRDVTPANILVTDDGTAKIGDFGIARMHGDQPLTMTGFVTGTPSYFSPELAEGHDPGPASDVWALGATLFTAVEGRPPFPRQRNPVAMLHTIATQAPATPRRAGPLEQPLQRMLDRDPASRWSMADAAHALRRVADRHAADLNGDRTAAFPAPAWRDQGQPDETQADEARADEGRRDRPAAGVPAGATGAADTAGAVGAAGAAETASAAGAADTAGAAGTASAAGAADAAGAAGAVGAAGAGKTPSAAGAADAAGAATRASHVPGAPAAGTVAPTAPDSTGREPGGRGALGLLAALVVLLLVAGAGYLLLGRGTGSGQEKASGTHERSVSPSTSPSQSASRSVSTSPSPAHSPAASPTRRPVSPRAAQRAFLRGYYATVPGDLDAGWAKLGPHEQAQGRASYDRFWGSVRRVDVASVRPHPATSTADLTVTYHFRDGRVVVERQRLDLVRSTHGGWLIDDDTVLSSRTVRG